MCELVVVRDPERVHDTFQLRRYPRERPEAMPVLLLHGASARHETFLVPPPTLDTDPRALAPWLWQRGYEPWLLDWRGSGLVLDDLAEHHPDKLAEYHDVMDFRGAATYDVYHALRIIQRARPHARAIGAVGHCMGGASLAEYVARSTPPPGDEGRPLPPLTHLVLLTMGLFYETPLASYLKNQDPVLDRIEARRPDLHVIDARNPDDWPDEIREIYANWPNKLRPHGGQPRSEVRELCDRLSFMYGAPYLEANLAPEIHHDTARIEFDRGRIAPQPEDDVHGERSGARARVRAVRRLGGRWSDGTATGHLLLVDPRRSFQEGEPLSIRGRVAATVVRAKQAKAELLRQFGGIPLRMYAHGAQNARRGWAGEYRGDDEDADLIGQASLENFRRLTKITLVTGAQNQLWHRDGIDRMYEWLQRDGHHARGRSVRKHVLPGYGHQDLLWGESAARDVYPKIEAGLRTDIADGPSA